MNFFETCIKGQLLQTDATDAKKRPLLHRHHTRARHRIHARAHHTRGRAPAHSRVTHTYGFSLYAHARTACAATPHTRSSAITILGTTPRQPNYIINSCTDSESPEGATCSEGPGTLYEPKAHRASRDFLLCFGRGSAEAWVTAVRAAAQHCGPMARARCR